MLKLPSYIKNLALLAMVLGIALSISSCGTQKMGCPGSITKNEVSSESRG
jgi:hypothetical protein